MGAAPQARAHPRALGWRCSAIGGVQQLLLVLHLGPAVRSLLSGYLSLRSLQRSLLRLLQGFNVHGGPPVVRVPAELSGDGAAYYLGIMHFWT
jgi:hypothetical protein